MGMRRAAAGCTVSSVIWFGECGGIMYWMMEVHNNLMM